MAGNTKKQIEEFLELDKSDAELIEGIASCHYDYGHAYGRLKGKGDGWGEAADLAMTLFEEGKVSAEVMALFGSRFLNATKKADKTTGLEDGLLKDSAELEEAAWNVLRRRLKSLREEVGSAAGGGPQ